MTQVSMKIWVYCHIFCNFPHVMQGVKETATDRMCMLKMPYSAFVVQVNYFSQHLFTNICYFSVICIHSFCIVSKFLIVLFLVHFCYCLS